MRIPLLAAAAGALALSACATPAAPRTGLCDAGPGQLFVGQKADAAAGLAIRRATGADTLRWAPPRTAMTMEFQDGRTTVAYDDAMVITAVSCG